MPLKNYTTSISEKKTIDEIESMLSKFGATRSYKMYEEGVVKALAFAMVVNGKEIPFKLPMNEDKIMQVFENQYKRGKLQRTYVKREQARRTGWRIIKDWVDSQVALMEIELAKPEEVFLPYMFNEKLNMTMFEMLEKKNFNMQLEHKDVDVKSTVEVQEK